MDDDFPFYDDDDYDIMDYELYGDDVWPEEEEEDAFITKMTFIELYNACIETTVASTFPVIGKILLYCSLLRVTNSFVELPASLIHLTSMTSGLLALHSIARHRMSYVVVFVIIAYFVLLLSRKMIFRKFYGACYALAIVFLLIIGEIFMVDSKDWHVIRGIQMVLSMKLISLSFDLNSEVVINFPTPLEFGGYCFCVGTIIFGPWMSYNHYLKILSKNRITWKWASKLFISIVMAVLFLILSACICQWIIPNNSNKWLLAYRDALSFRSSHYFVSFISEVTFTLVGFEGPDGSNMIVSQPHLIEIPRSLTEVVIYWNKPVHYWLKTYIFKTFQPVNIFLAIFCTYAASSLLHGLNFQLSAVLLSLGFYTFIEFNFRKKLANIFSACILARKCNNVCHHINKMSSPAVILTNLSFGLLAMFHLAYLGVMFDNSSTEQDQGYSMDHTLSKWSDLNYASHWVTVGMYTVHWLV